MPVSPLKYPEILKEIFEWLCDIKGSSVYRKRTLLSAALTCRRWSRPALTQLWRTFATIDSVMKLFELHEKYFYEIGKSTISLYTHAIRKLTLKRLFDSSVVTVFNRVYHTHSILSEEQDLFFGLRELNISITSVPDDLRSTDILFLCILLGPNIRTVSISPNTKPSFAAHLLRLLPLRCSLLKVLQLDCKRIDGFNIKTGILVHENLQAISINVEWVTPRLLEALGRLNLTKLSIKTKVFNARFDHSISTWRTRSGGKISLGSLQELELACSDRIISSIQSFLDLTKVRIVNLTMDPADMGTFSLESACVGWKGVQSFSLRVIANDGAALSRDSALSFILEDIWPLFQYSSLQDLRIKHVTNFDCFYNSDRLADFLSDLPHLLIFSLNPAPEYRIMASDLTVRDIRRILTRCRKLKRLELCIAVTSPKKRDPGNGCPSVLSKPKSCLKSITLGCLSPLPWDNDLTEEEESNFAHQIVATVPTDCSIGLVRKFGKFSSNGLKHEENEFVKAQSKMTKRILNYISVARSAQS